MRIFVLVLFVLATGCMSASREAALEARFVKIERTNLSQDSRIDQNTNEIRIHAGELGRVTAELGTNSAMLKDLTGRMEAWLIRQEAREAFEAEVRRRDAEAALLKQKRSHGGR